MLIFSSTSETKGDEKKKASASAPKHTTSDGAAATDNGVAWGQWFMEELDEDDDEDDEDFQPTLHACTTIFVVMSFAQ